MRGVVRTGAGLDLLRAPLHGRAHPRMGHRAVDGPGTTLPPDLVEACSEVLEPQLEMLVASGLFGEAVPVADDADPQMAARGARPPRRLSP